MKFTGYISNELTEMPVAVDIHHDGEVIDIVYIKDTEAEVVLSDAQVDHVEQQIELHLLEDYEEKAYHADTQLKTRREENGTII